MGVGRGWSRREVSVSRQLRRFLDNENQMIVFLQPRHRRGRMCFLLTLLVTHLDDRSRSLMFFDSEDCTPRFSSLHLDLFCTASFLFPWPYSVFHRGECVWDDIAVGLTARKPFSLASKTSSYLSS